MFKFLTFSFPLGGKINISKDTVSKYYWNSQKVLELFLRILWKPLISLYGVIQALKHNSKILWLNRNFWAAVINIFLLQVVYSTRCTLSLLYSFLLSNMGTYNFNHFPFHWTGVRLMIFRAEFMHIEQRKECRMHLSFISLSQERAWLAN